MEWPIPRAEQITATAIPNMNRSELIKELSSQFQHLTQSDVELAIATILENIGNQLAGGGRIEIRGFGSFGLNYRPPRNGRNPKTGVLVAVPAKYVPHFKPGSILKDAINS